MCVYLHLFVCHFVFQTTYSTGYFWDADPQFKILSFPVKFSHKCSTSCHHSTSVTYHRSQRESHFLFLEADSHLIESPARNNEHQQSLVLLLYLYTKRNVFTNILCYFRMSFITTTETPRPQVWTRLFWGAGVWRGTGREWWMIDKNQISNCHWWPWEQKVERTQNGRVEDKEKERLREKGKDREWHSGTERQFSSSHP